MEHTDEASAMLTLSKVWAVANEVDRSVRSVRSILTAISLILIVVCFSNYCGGETIWIIQLVSNTNRLISYSIFEE